MPREYREQRMIRVLREQLYENIHGMQEAVIVSLDGLVVASYPSVDEEQDALNETSNSHSVAALAAEIIAQSRRALGRLSQGEVSRILVGGETGSMIVVPAGERAALAVMVDTDAKLGLAMSQIAHVAKHIGRLLD